MNTNKLLAAALLASTTLIAGCSDQTVDEVITGAGDFAEPPAEHAATPVGQPGEEILEYQDQSRWSCRTQKVSMQENPERFVTLNPNADIIYPGALVQGGSLDSGSPQPIPVARGEGTIVLSLVNGAEASFQKKLDEVTQGNVVQAQNDLLAGIKDSALPAKFVYDYDLFDSEEKLAAAMDVKVEWLSGSSVHAAAEASSEKHVTRAVIRLTQEYFTTTFDMPTSTKAFFAPSVTGSELADYVQPGNPAAYISSVTYGRQFYLVFESTASKQELKAAVDAVYSGLVVDASGHMDASLMKTQSETRVKVFAIGGAAESALDLAAAASTGQAKDGMFDKLSSYLRGGGTFSTANPGLPVSYTVRDVAHRSVVKVNLGTEFTERQCNPLVDQHFKALSLDANNAIYDSNGFMSSWHSDTLSQNDPSSFSNMIKTTDSNGHTWARMQNNSYAAGIDCKALAGASTVITVSKPDIGILNGNTGPVYILSGGELNPTKSAWTQGWSLGWYADKAIGYATYTSSWGQNGGMYFTASPQSNGHITTSVLVPGQYMYQFSNGVSLNWDRSLGGGLASGLGGQRCAVGSVINTWAQQGLVGEVQIYSGELTSAQREMVECQLGAKWGIGVQGCKDGRPVRSY